MSIQPIKAPTLSSLNQRAKTTLFVIEKWGNHACSEMENVFLTTRYDLTPHATSPCTLENAFEIKQAQIPLNDTINVWKNTLLQLQSLYEEQQLPLPPLLTDSQLICGYFTRHLPLNRIPTDVYICYDPQTQQIEGMFRVTKYTNWIVIDLLMTNPKNLPLLYQKETPRKGVGTQCIRFVEKMAREASLATLCLDPLDSAISFYGNQGFKLSYTVDRYGPLAHMDKQLC